MEGEVVLKCRKSDLELVKQVSDAAAEDYKALMKREVKYFNDREVPLKIIIEDKRFLAEYNANEGSDSCMGGIVLHARRGRIVCSNTLDERL